MRSRYNELKATVHDVLNVHGPDDRVGIAFSRFSISLILVTTTAVVLESVQEIQLEYGALLDGILAGTTWAFAIEYVLRLWSCTAEREYSRPILGRLKQAMSPLALIDLLAIAASFASSISVSSLLALRSARLLRLLNALKIARYSRTVQMFARVFWAKRNELQVALFLNLMLILMSSTVLYMIEHQHQPSHFSSIPATMWWAAMTLTTVGYGDVYPITPLGKFMTTVVAFFGIGLFALPTSILASGFMQEALMKRARDGVCPACHQGVPARGQHVGSIDVPEAPRDDLNSVSTTR